jgi:hypothetical protein
MDFSIPEFLSDEHSLGVFLLVTVVMGGGAAWLAGRAIAATWRHWWHLALYMVVLSLAVRFMHFALFDSKFLSLHYYLVDYAVCLAFGLLGFHLMRVTQMVTRYGWINERAGPFRCGRRAKARIWMTIPSIWGLNRIMRPFLRDAEIGLPVFMQRWTL